MDLMVSPNKYDYRIRCYIEFWFILHFFFSNCQVLELICTREAGAVFEAGGLACVLSFIRDNASIIHKDTLHSAMSVVSR